MTIEERIRTKTKTTTKKTKYFYPKKINKSPKYKVNGVQHKHS